MEMGDGMENRNQLQYNSNDVISVWENVSQNYDCEKYWNVQNRANLQRLLYHIGDPQGKTIIEVGSGSAFTSLTIAKMGAEVSLLDISKVTLDLAIKNFVNCGMTIPKCYCEDALNNSVPTGTYDVVWNGGVIEHFFNDGKKKLILEMLRMAKPDGVVIILVPNSWCIEFQIIQVLLKLSKKWIYGFEDDMSPRRLRMMCKELRINNVEAYSFNPIAGWLWIPIINNIIRHIGIDTLDRHIKKSIFGNVTALVIKKCCNENIHDHGL